MLILIHRQQFSSEVQKSNPRIYFKKYFCKYKPESDTIYTQTYDLSNLI